MGFILKPEKFKPSIAEALKDLDPGLRRQIESMVEGGLTEEKERRIISLLGEEKGRRVLKKIKGLK